MCRGFLAIMNSSDIPLLHEEGWMRLKKMSAKPPFVEAARYRACASPAPQPGGQSPQARQGAASRNSSSRPSAFSILDHPVRSAKEASRCFIDVAATPPHRGGECS